MWCGTIVPSYIKAGCSHKHATPHYTQLWCWVWSEVQPTYAFQSVEVSAATVYLSSLQILGWTCSWRNTTVEYDHELHLHCTHPFHRYNSGTLITGLWLATAAWHQVVFTQKLTLFQIQISLLLTADFFFPAPLLWSSPLHSKCTAHIQNEWEGLWRINLEATTDVTGARWENMLFWNLRSWSLNVTDNILIFLNVRERILWNTVSTF